MNKFFKICFLIAVLSILSSCARDSYSVMLEGAMDTVSEITVFCDKNAENITNDCVDIITKYDNLFSPTKPDSDVVKINTSFEGVEVASEITEILKESYKFYLETDGKFDITVGALSQYWNDAIKEQSIPDEKTLEELKKLTDYTSLKIEDNSVLRTIDNQKITLGAVAKGFIADRINEYLKTTDATGAMVNLGGNILAFGTKKDNSCWKTGIRCPDNSGELIGAISVRDKFVVTSGDYERFFDDDNTRYHHIIDAKTGYPSNSDLRSVTIISDNGLLADAMSTSCFLTGLEKSKELCQKYLVYGIFITKDKKVYYPEQIKDSFEAMNSDYEYIIY